MLLYNITLEASKPQNFFLTNIPLYIKQKNSTPQPIIQKTFCHIAKTLYLCTINIANHVQQHTQYNRLYH